MPIWAVMTSRALVIRLRLSGDTLTGATGSAASGQEDSSLETDPGEIALTSDVIAGVRLPPPLCPPHLLRPRPRILELSSSQRVTGFDINGCSKHCRR